MFREFSEKLMEKSRHNKETMEWEVEKFRADMERKNGKLPSPQQVDFFVTNMEFTQRDSSAPWQIRAVGTKPGAKLGMGFVAGLKWKTRMMAAMNGIPTIQALRWDYASDIFIIVLFVSMMLRTG